MLNWGYSFVKRGALMGRSKIYFNFSTMNLVVFEKKVLKTLFFSMT